MKDTPFGKYILKNQIAEGGMGEVYTAYDPAIERIVALKRIKKKLEGNPVTTTRFLQEARITAQLSHPSVIPIYDIDTKEKYFYTMPYVEGETLRTILKNTADCLEENTPPPPLGASIPQLIQVFLQVCNGVHFAHTKGILHRDLKSDNILVGTFGEVYIIDWGLAVESSYAEDDPDVDTDDTDDDLTKPGKVVGTLQYMAPERVFKYKASVQSEVYALGVILYQLLTLKLPFSRKSIKEFRKQATKETYFEPSEVAPHRDIPTHLTKCIAKCLAFHPEDRYTSVEELVHDVQAYIEGAPEWTFSTSLDPQEKSAWEFQENILLARHIAITRLTDIMEWVMFMISKPTFTGNIRLSLQFKPHSNKYGFGLLLNVPIANERKSLEDGYLVYFSSDADQPVTLYRSNVEVLSSKESHIQEGKSNEICIERIDSTIKVIVNGKLVLNYRTNIPLVGGHIGLIYRSFSFAISPIEIATGSRSIMVNCLAVPDAFLNSRDYDTAIDEYTKIATSFRGRAEGREATFRAGLTLIEKGKVQRFTTQKHQLFKRAREEFAKLSGTPGAPLEYLGKSLVAKAEEDFAEEVLTLEFGVRKYNKHPLLPLLEEHIIFRTLESAQENRFSAYSFTFLSLNRLPQVVEKLEKKDIFLALKKHIERPFFYREIEGSNAEHDRLNLAILLSFWLTKPAHIYEKLETYKEADPILFANALFALEAMGVDLENVLKKIPLLAPVCFAKTTMDTLFKKAHETAEYGIQLLSMLRLITTKKEAEKVIPLFAHFNSISLDPFVAEKLKHVYIYLLLLTDDQKKAGQLLGNHIKEATKDHKSPYFSLYGCYLVLTEKEAISDIHFEGITESKKPPTTSLLGHYVLGSLDLGSSKSAWEFEAFSYERQELYRYLILYYTCLGKTRKVSYYQKQFDLIRSKLQIDLDFL